MLLTILLTFLATTGLYGLAMWFACSRISRHLRDNTVATSAVVQHVLVPLLGGQPGTDENNCAPEPTAALGEPKARTGPATRPKDPCSSN
jgi:hypothetical protein